MWEAHSDTPSTVSRVSFVDVFYVPSFLRDEGGSGTAEPPRTVGLSPGTRKSFSTIPESPHYPSATA